MDLERQRTFIDTRRELLEHLSAGGRLMLTRQQFKTEPELWSDPDGVKTFTAAACHWAIARNLATQCADGLFGDGQTYEPDICASGVALAKHLGKEAVAVT